TDSIYKNSIQDFVLQLFKQKKLYKPLIFKVYAKIPQRHGVKGKKKGARKKGKKKSAWEGAYFIITMQDQASLLGECVS
ncbi:MAG: hypothetical protein LBT59_29955, partial [Clostridiales bacterium]|nr:hypothetical protein [Clostridiales bacterium]